jgi:hypothetical protein
MRTPVLCVAAASLFVIGCQPRSSVGTSELQAEVAQLKADKAKLELKNTLLSRDLGKRDRIIHRFTCISNLRILDSAKEQWGMATGQPLGAQPSASDLSGYIQGGFYSLSCPEGGAYSLGPFGQLPRCNVPGHEL